MTAALPTTSSRRAWVQQVMGMPVSVQLRGPGSRSGQADSRVQAVYDELRAVDVLFSPYRADSEVSRLDRGGPTVADAHPLVAEVVALCEAAAVLTGGSFDPFYPARHGAPGRNGFDPTGLVRGWALQRAAEHLAAGLDCDVSVNAGGDIALRAGTDPSPWRIGIEDPADPSRVIAVVPVRDGAVATSGATHRGAHISHGRTGVVPTAVASVTVVAPDLTRADIDATAAYAQDTDALSWLRGRSGRTGLVVWTNGSIDFSAASARRHPTARAFRSGRWEVG
jgi:FAD:protein FMN transferase